MSMPVPPQPQPPVSPEMRETLPGATPPPPAYQDNINNANTNSIGETYYQPPPPPMSYPPPPLQEPQGTPAIGNRIAEYYSPQNNKKLATRRRLYSCLCILISIGIIVGLAAGLTSSAYYSNCECRTNLDCSTLYGANVYCNNNCNCMTSY